MHSDLWILAVTVASFLLVGLPAIRARVAMPARIAWREVPESELTPLQRDFFADYDRKLAPLGYAPLCWYKIGNLSAANLARLYQSSLGSGIAFVAAITSAHRANPIAMSYLEFVQDFQDGTRLSTRNTQLSTVFARGPQDVLQECPALTDPADLKQRHDERARSLPLVPVSAGDTALIFKRAEDHQRRFCEYQVSRGLLRYDAAAGLYRATYLTGLNGIQNFLNPFADNFSWSRTALALLFGLGLPAAGTLAGLSAAKLLPCYAAAGLVVGAIFSSKAFIWAFLLGFIASRVWPPADAVRLPLCLAMAFAADAAGRWRRRLGRVV